MSPVTNNIKFNGQPGDNSKDRVSVTIPKPILDLISENDNKFLANLNKYFYLKNKVKLSTIKGFNADPNSTEKLIAHFFHFIEALPLLSKTNQINLSDNSTIAKFFKDLETFSENNLERKIPNSNNQRISLMLLYQVLTVGAKVKEDVPLKKLLKEASEFLIHHIFTISQPENFKRFNINPFNAKEYLEQKLMALANLANDDLKKQLQDVLQIVIDSDKFSKFIDDQAHEIFKREQLLYEPSDTGWARDTFDASEQIQFYQKLRRSYDVLKETVSNFLFTNKDATSFNGDFTILLKNELAKQKHKDISVDFPFNLNKDKDTEIKIYANLTLQTIKDLYTLGYKDFAFKNFLMPYGFNNFSKLLSKYESMTSEDIQKLVVAFLDLKNSSQDFKSYSLLNVLRDPSKIDPITDAFIDFLDKLKSLTKKINVKVFPCDEDQTFNQWVYQEKNKKVFFGDGIFATSPPESYNIKFDFYYYDPKDMIVNDEDVEDYCLPEDDEDLNSEYVFHAHDSIPLAVTDVISNDARQELKDRAIFSLAALPALKTEVEDKLTEAHENEGLLKSVFEDFNNEIEPDMLRLVYLRSDDDDGDEEEVCVPNDTPSLTLVP